MTFESLRRYSNYPWGVQQNQTMPTNCSWQYLRSFFFFGITIEILFDKREIHVQTQQPCKHKYRGTKTCSAENKICNKINTAHGHRIQKQQQILQLPPVSTNYADNPEPVLQKTKYAATEIQPVDIHNRNNNNSS